MMKRLIGDQTLNLIDHEFDDTRSRQELPEVFGRICYYSVYKLNAIFKKNIYKNSFEEDLKELNFKGVKETVAFPEKL